MYNTNRSLWSSLYVYIAGFTCWSYMGLVDDILLKVTRELWHNPTASHEMLAFFPRVAHQPCWHHVDESHSRRDEWADRTETK
jgi:hypothetical protein